MCVLGYVLGGEVYVHLAKLLSSYSGRLCLCVIASSCGDSMGNQTTPSCVSVALSFIFFESLFSSLVQKCSPEGKDSSLRTLSMLKQETKNQKPETINTK